VNNVNSNETILNSTNLDGVARIADAFRPWGIQLGLSLYFASPQALGDLDTFDPLNASVIQWWNDKTDEIYDRIPDFAGYLVKANSEGQPGPAEYNRTLADGANLFAHALKPHGGLLFFRAFVYDHTSLNQTLDWKADRANAAVEFFQELDGHFDDNVIVQIKYGPIDFQVREPVSPLFAHLRQTPSAIELQVTQEYLGQQAHLVYL
jgi:alpha-glucuronidase